MIIGTITLLTILFMGGGINPFYLKSMKKGVKSYVEEKDRQKELLDRVKAIEKSRKEFQKTHDNYFKEFEVLFNDQGKQMEEMDSFFQELLQEMDQYYDWGIKERLWITERITEDEWKKIIALERDRLEEEKEKPELNYLEKTRSWIENNIRESIRAEEIIQDLEELIQSIHKLDKKAEGLDIRNEKVLLNKNSSKKDLQGISTELQELRAAAYQAVANFHESVRRKTSEKEWKGLSKVFLKEVEKLRL